MEEHRPLYGGAIRGNKPEPKKRDLLLELSTRKAKAKASISAQPRTAYEKLMGPSRNLIGVQGLSNFPAPLRPAVAQQVLKSLADPIDDFWGQIANTVPGVDRNEVIEVLKKLAFFDSIHDFWPERSTVKAVGDEDEDEPEELDEMRIDAVHGALVNTIRRYLGMGAIAGDAATQASLILKSTTGNFVGGTSGVEDRVLAYFKKTYAPFNEPEGYMTISEILSSWKAIDKSPWQTYSAAVGALPNGLDIVFDGYSVKSLTDTQRNQVAFFLLAYMNPTVQPTDDNLEYFTFDMAPRDIGKIFDKITQVKNAIYPQNIADSASTSFSALRGRSAFFRADGTQAGGAAASYKVRSNAFTSGTYNLYFVDDGFGPQNKFGFHIEVRNKATNALLGSIPFGPRNEQGPSVNYLMDIISALNTAVTDDQRKAILRTKQPNIGTVAKLTGLEGVPDQNLLFDIKRMGDQEQMLLNGVIAVTGDRFAGAFRRLLRRSGMYHSSRGIKVWRGTEGLDAGAIEDRRRQFRKQQVLSKLTIVASLISDNPQPPSGIRAELLKMKEHVDHFAGAGYVHFRSADVPNPITSAYVSATYTLLASTFATSLLRSRMRDISDHIQMLIDKVDALRGNIPGIRDAACAVKNEPGCPNPPMDIDLALNELEEFIKQIDELEALDISFRADGGAVEPIFVKLFEDSGRLIKGATSIKFNFSAGPYNHPETGLATVVSRLLVISKSRRPESASEKINKLLVQYFQARDAAKEAFFDGAKKADVESRTDIASGLTPADVVSMGPDKDGLIGAIQFLIHGDKPALAAVGPPGVQLMNRYADDRWDGRGGAQVGGAGSPLQYRDLHDLFLDLCVEATMAIETDKDPYETLDDIEASWVTGLEELHSQAEEDYGVKYEASVTVDFISYMLSIRSDANPLFEIPPAISNRNRVQFNFLAGRIVGQENVEQIILEILSKIGKVMIEAAETGRETYDSYTGWVERLPNTIQALVINPNPRPEVMNLLRGGGLEGGDESSSNAGDTRTGSSRRNLYAGLRKRGGAGTPPRV